MSEPEYQETQDNGREKQLIELYGLKAVESRIRHDAEDRFGNWFELKTLTTKTNSLSTARQVHLSKIMSWRQRYWIVAKGRTHKSGMDIEEAYILHPDDLEPEFKKHETAIQKRLDVCLQVIKQSYAPKDLLLQVSKIMEAGTRLENPKISWAHIRNVGQLLPSQQPSASQKIEDFVKCRPLTRSEVPKNQWLPIF